MTHPRFDGGIGHTPWTSRPDLAGKAVPNDMKEQFLPADGVLVAGITVEGKPALLLTFGWREQRYPPIALLHIDGLPELIAQAVEGVRALDGLIPTEPPPEHVTCAGCGRRLFGDVALFGVCLRCRDNDDDGDGDDG